MSDPKKNNKAQIPYRELPLTEMSGLFEFYRCFHEDAEAVEKYFRWRQKGLPASGGNRPLVVEVNGKIAGAVNVMPVKLVCKGQNINAAWQGNTLVSPEMRGRGVGKRLLNEGATGYPLTLGKGTTLAMYQLKLKEGFQDVPHSNYLIKVLTPWRIKRPLPKKLIFFIYTLLGRLKYSATKVSDLEIQVIKKFDERYDQLAEQLSRCPDLKLYKNSHYLNWRYVDCPDKNYLILQAVREDNLLGAMVISPNKTSGETAWILDIIGDVNKPGEIGRLLDEAIQYVRSLQAADIRIFATSGKVRKILIGKGFININYTPRFTYRFVDKALEAELAGVEWNFWQGDGDYELYQ
jgi:GNAT superfamily N-acetyltransferase